MADSSHQRRVVRIGTRKSKLAMVQAEHVKATLEQHYTYLDFEIVSIVTAGDRNKTTPLHKFGAKSLWTLDLEELLLKHEVDLIVHCLKDMPTALPAGCKIGSIMEREDPRDALVVKEGLPYKTLEDLPSGSIIGTSSVRRGAQVIRQYPHLKLMDIRGNLDTRLSKLDNPELPYTALLLASAGLIRMNLRDRIASQPSHPILLYAVGQGALAIEVRENDEEVQSIIDILTHEPTKLACLAERALMRRLEGGCSVPIGVETEFINGNTLVMRTSVSSVDGREHVALEDKLENVDSVVHVEDFGARMATALSQMGAESILANIKRAKDESAQAAAVAESEEKVMEAMQERVNAEASSTA